MIRNSDLVAGAIGLVALWSIGCHRQALTVSLGSRPPEDHCWWAVMRSPLRPDSVAVRFQRAFTAVGMTGATWTHNADTAWVHAGPTALSESGGATYESRVVAYWYGDSTHYRQYVAVTALAGDSVNLGQRTIPFCGATARAADVQGSAPQTPTGEETLKIWTRTP